MDKPYLLGVDVGSGSCKVTLIDRHGQSRGEAQAGYTPSLPRPQWAEMDPHLWYAAFGTAARQCLQSAGAAAHDVLALAVCGPAHNVALLDAHDRLLRPMLL